MSKLQQAMERYSAALERFGKLDSIRLREPFEVQDEHFSGVVLSEYFSRFDSEVTVCTAGAFHLMWFPLPRLATAQSGWRWIRDKSGQVREDASWPKSWIVLADRNGDAIVVDDSSDAGTVYGSIQKRSFQIAGGLPDFLFLLADCVDLEKQQFDYEVMDEDFNYIDAFLQGVESLALKHLGADNSQGFMKFFFG